ncbi:MAG: DUF4340 domain-containing protein [Myxococcaceae bacterium]|nr:DUF4340 domain-containing protein [Myxococcaceae bacterium]
MSQIQKTLLSLVVLVAGAAGVGFYAYQGVHQADQKKAAQKDLEERLFAPDRVERSVDGGARADFVRLVVTAQGETTVLEREPGGPWRITAPIQAKVDALVVDGVVSQLQTARFKASLEGEATDAELEKYGLAKPRFSVEAEALVDGQKKTAKLEGGVENPFDGSIFMRRDGSRKIQVAEGGVRWSLAKTTFDLREKAIFTFDEATTTRFSLKSAANDWSFEKRDDTLWHFTRPEDALADTVSVTGLFGALRGERATAFVSDVSPASRTALGFDTPLSRVVVESGGKSVTFTLAAPQGDAGEGLYAMREDGDERLIAQVAATARNTMDRNIAELRDRSVIPFARQKVTKLVFKGRERTVAVEREPGSQSIEGWKVTAPKPGPARAYKVANALWMLSAVKAGEVISEKPDASSFERFGLDDKAARIVTLSGEKGVLAELRIGRAVDGKQGFSYAVGTRRVIVEIDASRLNELPWDVEELLDVPGDAGPPK